jgi:hypothetical protein
MEAFEYAIKKDVRNNPIVREVDESRQRELWTSIGVAGFLVLVLLVSAWQHFELLEALATQQLHLVTPTRDEAIVIERVVPAEPPAASVVARR